MQVTEALINKIFSILKLCAMLTLNFQVRGSFNIIHRGTFLSTEQQTDVNVLIILLKDYDA